MNSNDVMQIVRPRLAFETRFMQVRNEWVRDRRITGDPLSVFLFMLSHDQGFTLTQARVREALGLGRDRFAKSIRTLEDAGYLARHQQRFPDGRVGRMVYVLQDPFEPDTEVEGSKSPENRQSLPVTENPYDGKVYRSLKNRSPENRSLENSTLKKTKLRTPREQEHHRAPELLPSVASEPPVAADDDSSLRSQDTTPPTPRGSGQPAASLTPTPGASRGEASSRRTDSVLEVDLVRAAVEQRLGRPLPADVDLAAAIRAVSARATQPVSNRVRWLAAAIARTPDAWRRIITAAPAERSCHVTGEHHWGPAEESPNYNTGVVDIVHRCRDCGHTETIRSRRLATAS